MVFSHKKTTPHKNQKKTKELNLYVEELKRIKKKKKTGRKNLYVEELKILEYNTTANPRPSVSNRKLKPPE